MYAILLAATLAADPAAADTYATPADAAAAMAAEVQTGTLLFSTGDCLAVRIYTQSHYTHVAVVVAGEGGPVVYDSQNGVGVRRLTLEEYLDAQSPDALNVCHPRRPFSRRRTELLVTHLEQELGRPYEVKHHLTGNRSEGIHCAEYATDALMNCRLVHAHRPAKVSPASLREGLLEGDLYDEVRTIQVRPPVPEPVEDVGWCEQLWIDTKTCTSHCCRKLSGWILCR